VVTTNVAEIAFAKTVTLGGVTALGSLDARLTTKPPAAARAFRVTVPVEELPPVTVLGASARLAGNGGVTVRTVTTVAPCPMAVMVTGVDTDTGEVVIVNVPNSAPAATLTDAGVTAIVLLDDKFTTEPPAGAGNASVTLPEAEMPPATGFGVAVKPVRKGVPMATRAPVSVAT
jgi:hypothetical protein